MKNLATITATLLLLATTSCSLFKTLTSNTLIEGNNSFILGNNEHGTFSVKLKNVSSEVLEVFEAPIAGGKHSTVMVKPNQTVKVDVDKNTALHIKNNSSKKVNVELLVTGDTGLSMGYNK
jgi:hypothetical protein